MGEFDDACFVGDAKQCAANDAVCGVFGHKNFGVVNDFEIMELMM